MAIEILNPCDIPEQLVAYGLKLDEYGSCAPREMGKGTSRVLGCECDSKCKFSVKGTAGPENVKVLTVKRNGNLLERVVACFHYIKHMEPENKNPNGNIHKVVGVAGDMKDGKPLTYKVQETKPKQVMDGGRSTTHHDDVVVERTVEKFVRIGDNPKLVRQKLAAEIRSGYTADEIGKKFNQRMGFPVQTEESPTPDVPAAVFADKGEAIVEKPRKRS